MLLRGARPAAATLRPPAAAARYQTVHRCRSVTARRASATCGRRATCRARCATTWCGSDTRSRRAAGSRPMRWRSTSISRAAAGRRRISTRRSCGTGSARRWAGPARRTLLDWLSGRLEPLGDAARRSAFVAAVRGNLMFPADADPLVALVCDAEVACDAEAGRELAAAGADFFEQALAAWRGNAPDFKAWTRAVGAATARKGAGLFMPLRAALTGTDPRAGARAARRADGPGARGGTTGERRSAAPRRH